MAAAGVLAAGLAVPAGASEQITVTQVSHMTRAVVHLHHLRHLAHLAHEARMRGMLGTPRISTAAARVSPGLFSFSALEAIWREAGGSAAAEVTAACIAEHESGGRSWAISPTDDWGLWQINASHGPAMATLSPLPNARAAVIISSDGRDWSAWTTHGYCGV